MIPCTQRSAPTAIESEMDALDDHLHSVGGPRHLIAHRCRHEQCERSLCDDQMRQNLVCNRSHGPCCFSMIITRPSAMMAMGQAVVKEYNQARRPWHTMAQRGVLKSWGDGGLSLSVSCYYSGTWSWVKPLTIPESLSMHLYNTCLVRVLIVNALCGALTIFN